MTEFLWPGVDINDAYTVKLTFSNEVDFTAATVTFRAYKYAGQATPALDIAAGAAGLALSAQVLTFSLTPAQVALVGRRIARAVLIVEKASQPETILAGPWPIAGEGADRSDGYAGKTVAMEIEGLAATVTVVRT